MNIIQNHISYLYQGHINMYYKKYRLVDFSCIPNPNICYIFITVYLFLLSDIFKNNFKITNVILIFRPINAENPVIVY